MILFDSQTNPGGARDDVVLSLYLGEESDVHSGA